MCMFFTPCIFFDYGDYSKGLTHDFNFLSSVENIFCFIKIFDGYSEILNSNFLVTSLSNKLHALSQTLILSCCLIHVLYEKITFALKLLLANKFG
jgi:hypothetical protein